MTDSPHPLLALGQRALSSQPFSTLVGARLTELTPGLAVLRVPITDKLRQQHGHVHGGVLSYAADNALTFAGGSILGPNVLTAEFKINFLRPARGAALVARARSVYAGKRQAVCVCELSTIDDDGEETLCAIAQGTIIAVPTPGQDTADRTADGPAVAS